MRDFSQANQLLAHLYFSIQYFLNVLPTKHFEYTNILHILVLTETPELLFLIFHTISSNYSMRRYIRFVTCRRYSLRLLYLSVSSVKESLASLLNCKIELEVDLESLELSNCFSIACIASGERFETLQSRYHHII